MPEAKAPTSTSITPGEETIDSDEESSLFGSPPPASPEEVTQAIALALPTLHADGPNGRSGCDEIGDLASGVDCQELFDFLEWEHTEDGTDPVSDYVQPVEQAVPTTPFSLDIPVSSYCLISQPNSSRQVGDSGESLSLKEALHEMESGVAEFTLFPPSNTLGLSITSSHLLERVQELPGLMVSTQIPHPTSPRAGNYSKADQQAGELEAYSSNMIAAKEGIDPTSIFRLVGSSTGTGGDQCSWLAEPAGHPSDPRTAKRVDYSLEGSAAVHTLPNINLVRSPSKRQPSRPDFSLVTIGRRSNPSSPARPRAAAQKNVSLSAATSTPGSTYRSATAYTPTRDDSPSKVNIRGTFERSRKVVEAFKVQKKLQTFGDHNPVSAIRYPMLNHLPHGSALNMGLARLSLSKPEPSKPASNQAIDLDASLNHAVSQPDVIMVDKLDSLSFTRAEGTEAYTALAPSDFILKSSYNGSDPSKQAPTSVSIANSASPPLFGTSFSCWPELPPLSENLWLAEESQELAGHKRTVSEALEEVMVFSMNYSSPGGCAEDRSSKRIRCL